MTTGTWRIRTIGGCGSDQRTKLQPPRGGVQARAEAVGVADAEDVAGVVTIPAPRVRWVPPRACSLGPDAIEFATVLGVELDGHQAEGLDAFMGRDDRDGWTMLENGLCEPRQNGKTTAFLVQLLFGGPGQLRAALKAAGITDHVRPFHDLRHPSPTNGAAVRAHGPGCHANMATTKRYLHLAGVVSATRLRR